MKSKPFTYGFLIPAKGGVHVIDRMDKRHRGPRFVYYRTKRAAYRRFAELTAQFPQTRFSMRWIKSAAAA